jgi:hypothetical protein
VSKIPTQLQTPPEAQAPKWWQSLQKLWLQMSTIVNGQLDLGAGVPLTVPSPVPSININAMRCVYVTGTPGSNDVVTHNLGRVPEGYIVIGLSAAVTVYSSPTAWTETQIFLRSTVGGVTVAILVF